MVRLVRTIKQYLCWVRCQVLIETSIKMALFWDVMLCSLVKLTDVSEVLTAYYHDDGGSNHLQMLVYFRH
jgi:hypothetical protein